MLITPAYIKREVDFHVDREQRLKDEAADAEYERRERAANRIVGARGFDEVIEVLAGLPDARKAELMDAYGRDSHFVWLLSTAFADAFEAAADIRVAQGD